MLNSTTREAGQGPTRTSWSSGTTLTSGIQATKATMLYGDMKSLNMLKATRTYYRRTRSIVNEMTNDPTLIEEIPAC